MSLWGRIFAILYEPVLRASERNGLAELRAGLLAQASGRTLELGAGTGLNLEHYPPAVTELVLTEPEAAMAARLEERARGRSVRVVRAGAEELPFADGSFDTVVVTLVLCTVGDLERSLAEIRRVLTPGTPTGACGAALGTGTPTGASGAAMGTGGRLLFLEHVRHPDPARARRQERFTPIQRRVACGCHLDRDTPAAIAAAGLRLIEHRSEHFPKAAKVLQPLAVGSAQR